MHADIFDALEVMGSLLCCRRGSQGAAPGVNSVWKQCQRSHKESPEADAQPLGTRDDLSSKLSSPGCWNSKRFNSKGRIRGCELLVRIFILSSSGEKFGEIFTSTAQPSSPHNYKCRATHEDHEGVSSAL